MNIFSFKPKKLQSNCFTKESINNKKCTRTTSNLTAMFGYHKENDEKMHNDEQEDSSNINSESQYGQKNWKNNSIIDESDDYIESSEFTNYENERIEQGELLNSTTENNTKFIPSSKIANSQSKKGDHSDKEIEEENKDIFVSHVQNTFQTPIKELKIHKNKISIASDQCGVHNFHFEKQNIDKVDKNSFLSETTRSSQWVRIVDDKNNLFYNQQNIIDIVQPENYVNSKRKPPNFEKFIFAESFLKNKRKSMFISKCRCNPFQYGRTSSAEERLKDNTKNLQNLEISMIKSSSVCTATSFISPIKKIKMERNLLSRCSRSTTDYDSTILNSVINFNK